jgi:hypothetical protein
MLEQNSCVNRRDFLRTVGAGTAALGCAPLALAEKEEAASPPETLVKLLHDSLTEKQRDVVCFTWGHKDTRRGVLRTHISNNWRITPPAIFSNFFTRDQQVLIRKIWEGIVNPDWVTRFDKQFVDDMGGFGKAQSIAIFGEPGTGKFEFVLSGRHGTVRCDGNSSDHLAFGGPIVYGHAGRGDYYEMSKHPENVFWHQALAANKVYQMLDGKQQKLALLPEAPDEAFIGFRTREQMHGIPVTELSGDQKEHVQQVLQLLIEPFRQTDRDEVVAALKKQGGLDQCFLSFYKRDDLGDDGVWDNWRLEGPAFVWHWRGAPHVHVWVHVADDPKVEINSKNLSGPLRKD